VEIFFLPFVPVIAMPPLGLVPAVLLAMCWARQRRRFTRAGTIWIMAGAVAWLLYTDYEAGVWGWSRGVVGPIRVDLLVIAPVLYILSFLGLRAWWQARRRARSGAQA